VLAVVIGLQLFLHRPIDTVLWAFRTDAIAFGVLIAMARHAEGSLKLAPMPPWPPFLAKIIPLLLLCGIAAQTCSHQVWMSTGLLAVVSAALVLIASFDRNVIVPWVPLRRALLWMGSRSFAIYLVHNPCFRATREIFHRLYPEVRPFDDRFAPMFLVVGLVMIVLVSESTYRLVETPLRELGRRLAARYARDHAPVVAAGVPVS
jgi:peptidoglycan/LPS O-acetylase OafA/YrhL